MLPPLKLMAALPRKPLGVVDTPPAHAHASQACCAAVLRAFGLRAHALGVSQRAASFAVRLLSGAVRGAGSAADGGEAERCSSSRP
jgi:hypothetical protein